MIVDFWYTQATRARHAVRSVIGGAGSPWNATVPASGRISPVRIETSVDLPAPLRPTRAWDSAGSTVRPTSRSATVAPNRLVTALACTTGTASSTGSPPSGAGRPPP